MFASDHVLVQMAVGPSHHGLQELVQLWKRKGFRFRHDDRPPYVRLDVHQLDAQLQFGGEQLLQAVWERTSGSTDLSCQHIPSRDQIAATV